MRACGSRGSGSTANRVVITQAGSHGTLDATEVPPFIHSLPQLILFQVIIKKPTIGVMNRQLNGDQQGDNQGGDDAGQDDDDQSQERGPRQEGNRHLINGRRQLVQNFHEFTPDQQHAWLRARFNWLFAVAEHFEPMANDFFVGIVSSVFANGAAAHSFDHFFFKVFLYTKCQIFF